MTSQEVPETQTDQNSLPKETKTVTEDTSLPEEVSTVLPEAEDNS